MQTTDFNALLPEGIIFNVRQIESMGLIKSDMLKKMILNRDIEVIKIGKKNHISRTTLISYLEENTIPAEDY